MVVPGLARTAHTMRQAAATLSLATVLALPGCTLARPRAAGGPHDVRRQPPAARQFENMLRIDLGGGVTIDFVRVPAGEFLMGSPASEPGRREHEGPQHPVQISQPFYVARFEVTQAQWRAVMGENPSWYKGDDLPVNRVSWFDCQEFCKRLSERVGLPVRLPTEAEWEYSCRAGATTAYGCGQNPGELGPYAWYDGNSRRQPNPVGGKLPNAWGLYDMQGNVWEWCEDPYHPSYEGAPSDGSAWLAEGQAATPVLRGGSWFSKPPDLRCAARIRRIASMRSGYIGFRVVLPASSDWGSAAAGPDNRPPHSAMTSSNS